ncbi:hypothetical protein VNO78_03504 [Psophocarpus tetragonolobus]|uniref:Uncharacterized protein n=1 Tax=Psophocarpus tetragonolobus TaxID=3891 RepID=A0AAN9T1L1_PSOTE
MPKSLFVTSTSDLYLLSPKKLYHTTTSTMLVPDDVMESARTYNHHNIYVLANSTTLPASVGNGIVFTEYPMTDLKIVVKIADNLTQMQVQINLVNTVFGVVPPSVPMPKSINLTNDGFLCCKSNAQVLALIRAFFGAYMHNSEARLVHCLHAQTGQLVVHVDDNALRCPSYIGYEGFVGTITVGGLLVFMVMLGLLKILRLSCFVILHGVELA